MKHSQEEINALLSKLSPADIYTLLTPKTSVPRASSRKEIEKEMIHEYHCELCSSIKKRSYFVKISSSVEGLPHYNKPVVIHTVCEKCKVTYVLGLALAMNMIQRVEA